MNIEWLGADVTAVETPDRTEFAIFELILAGHILGHSGHICGLESTL